MGQVAARGADLAILTSDNPRTEDPERILDDIEARCEGVAHVRIADRRAAILRALAVARPGDTVLLGGKGHETYQVVGTQLYGLPKRSSPIPTDQEVGLIFSQATGDFRLGISLVLLAGLRPQEAFRVGFEHVDCNNWTFLIPSSIRKAGHDNLLPLVDTLRVQLVNKSPMIEVDEAELSNELRRLSRWAGIREWRGLQTFRRVLVMWLEEEGYAGHAHMVTGHVRSDMAGHYTHGLGHLRLKQAILSSVESRLLRAVEQVDGQHKNCQQHPAQE